MKDVAWWQNVDCGAFEAQSIPTDTAILDVEAYKPFLQQRRVLVAQRLNQFLGA